MGNMTIDCFLKKAESIQEKINTDKSKISNFNIFTILDKETDEESTHCRFIYELLSPKGSHNQGDTFLKLFFQKIIGEEYPTGYVVVRREVWLTNESRLDLMIDTDNCCYLIEAKINAGEQYRQIERYCRYVENQKKDYKMYFLTLDGHLSQTDNGYTYFPISFKTHIIEWLKECKKSTNINTLIGAIEQYLQLLNKLTSEENQNMCELNELIKSNIRAAQDISNQLPYVKGEMIGKVLQELELYISEKHGLKLISEVDDYYQNKYMNYYANHKNGKNPRISFSLSSNENAENIYSLSIVVEYSLFIGCDILHLNEQSNCYIPRPMEEDFNYDKKYLFGNKAKGSSWYWWEYLKTNGENINFYEQNANFFDLFDENKYPKILNDIKGRIDEIINQLKTQGALE